jgi:hemerythrin|tara:strand:- start:1674 stop:1850 length:177 start_codon:yes stop_codon:yes gene_type:complete
MPRKSAQLNKHKITHDFILDLYKEAQKMEPTEKQQTVEKLKELIKYIGKEIVVDLANV